MQHDILIVGGGPAGISTALHIAQFAPELVSRVLVIEKCSYPRPKLCAGGLVVDAEMMLRHLGLDTAEVPHTDADLVHFEFDGKGLSFGVEDSHPLRMIRREEFDAWLAAKARERGISIAEGLTVKKVSRGTTGVHIETDQGDMHAAVVVGADGSNGIVRRCIFPKMSPLTARVIEVIVQPHDWSGHRPRDAYFDFLTISAGTGGYIWDFPTQVGGKPMRCWGICECSLRPHGPRASIKDMLEREMAHHGYDLGAYELQSHPIRLFSPFSSFAVPHVILAGDAAGTDPVFGEGISIALGYGHIAAKAIRDAFKTQNFQFGDYRRRILFSPMGRALLARKVISYILYFPSRSWNQKLIWQRLKTITSLVGTSLVLNWSKRMK
jgi:flavin-dependent dehydrogenase